LRDWYVEISSSGTTFRTDVAKRTVHPEWREIDVPKDLENEHAFELRLFRSTDDDVTRRRKTEMKDLRLFKLKGNYKSVQRVGYKSVRFDKGSSSPVVFRFETSEDATSCIDVMNNNNNSNNNHTTSFRVQTITFEIAQKSQIDLRDLVPLTQHDVRTNTLRDDLSSLPDMPMSSVLFELNDEITTLTPSTRLYCSTEIANRILGDDSEETKEKKEMKEEEDTNESTVPYNLTSTLEHMKRMIKCRAELVRCDKSVKKLQDDIGTRLNYNATSATTTISATLQERARVLRQACEQESLMLRDDEETCQRLHSRHRDMKQAARKLMHESETVMHIRFEKLQRELAHNTDELDMYMHFHDARRLKLVSQLRAIYPITISEDKNGMFFVCVFVLTDPPLYPSLSLFLLFQYKRITKKSTGARVFLIRGIALPDKNVYAHVEEQIATALGYVAHLVFMISKYLEIPLRYRLIHHASRSFVRDVITSASGGRGMNYPLFWRGGRREDFERAVSLLKQNIEQLMWARDVIPNAHGSKGILSNLYHFLNHILRS